MDTKVVGFSLETPFICRRRRPVSPGRGSREGSEFQAPWWPPLAPGADRVESKCFPLRKIRSTAHVGPRQAAGISAVC